MIQLKDDAAGRSLVEDFEGLQLCAYPDVLSPLYRACVQAGINPLNEGYRALPGWNLLSGAPWTIGYGHAIGVKPGDRLVSKEYADKLLDSDLDTWCEQICKLIGDAPTTQHQFNAMLDLTHNIGVAGFAGSSVLRLHKAGDYAGAARAFALWNKGTVDGKLVEVAGLTRRRSVEATIYLTPEEAPHPISRPETTSPDTFTPMPQAVEPPKSVTQSKTVIAGAVGGAASVAEVVNQVKDVTDTAKTTIDTSHSVLDLIQHNGLLVIGIIGAVAIGYVIWKYVIKARNGQVVVT